MRIYQFLRAESASAFLALVPIGIFIAASGTGPDYVTVGKESLCFRVVILFSILCNELPLIIKFSEELGGVLLVDLRCSPSINIEIDAESGIILWYLSTISCGEQAC